MFVLAITINYFFQVISYLIFARVLLSWVARDINNGIVQFIYQVTEPILAPIRNLLNQFGLGGTLDFSPIVAMLLMQVLGRMLLSLI